MTMLQFLKNILIYGLRKLCSGRLTEGELRNVSLPARSVPQVRACISPKMITNFIFMINLINKKREIINVRNSIDSKT